MNTLPRAITAQVLTDPDTYHNIRQRWSALMRSTRKHELTAAHHLLYMALLGKDWRKGFTRMTNRRKLENGAFNDWGLFQAVAGVRVPSNEAELLAPFDGLVTPPMLQRLREFLPRVNAYTYPLELFASYGFPFEAYILPASVSAASNERSADA